MSIIHIRRKAVAQRQAEEARAREVGLQQRAAEEAHRREARNRAMEAEEELFRQKAEEAIAQRQARVGKHHFLRKGEGHQAASEAAKTQADKEISEKARQDIIYYSILHAKKEGLIQELPPLGDKPLEDFGFQTLSATLQGKWHKQWSTVEESAFLDLSSVSNKAELPASEL